MLAIVGPPTVVVDDGVGGLQGIVGELLVRVHDAKSFEQVVRVVLDGL